MVSEIIHSIAGKIAFISIAFLSFFNPNVSFNEPRSVRIEITSVSPLDSLENYNENSFGKKIDLNLEKIDLSKIQFPKFTETLNIPTYKPKQTLPSAVVETPKQNIEIQKTEDVVPEKTVETPKIQTPVAPPPPELPNQISFSVITQETRQAIVNILCSTNISSLGSVTGSGVVVDPKGIILTNAHVAQLLLLNKARPGLVSDCIIRTGDPATPTYRGELLYISSLWVKAHPDTLAQREPRGTGENDYAFIRITGNIDAKKSLPISFPYINIDTDYVPKPEDVLILAGYPAGILDGISISNNLRLKTTAGYITEVFTFQGGTVDLFQIKDSVVAQSGSSGGAVVTNKNNLGGIIVTSVRYGDSSQSVALRAITSAHINRALITETNQSLKSLLSGDTSAKALNFQNTIAPDLAKTIVDAILK